jgi:hypothetical protein
MQVVEVEWVDSCYHQGWQDTDIAKNKQVSRCSSVGYVIRDDKDQLTIAQGMTSNDNVGDMVAIPRVSIIKVTTLIRRKSHE